jgi:dipicolinate synthase subunit A
MLTDVQIGVIGGDARQLQLIKKLCDNDASLYLVGFDELEEEIPGATKVKMDEVPVNELDAVILPASGTDLNGYIDTHFSDYSPQLTKDWAKNLNNDCYVFTGISNSYLSELCKEAGLTLIPLFDRNDVAIYNSIPTVEGAIMMAIQYTDITIHHSNVVVLGFGRVGRTLAKSFKGLEAKVKVGARKKEDLARIFEMGYEPFHMNEVSQHVNDCNILINTIPAPVVNVKVLQSMTKDALIIDLASKPGGTDFRYAKRRGIKAILTPSLPGIVAPKTAGNILAKVITEILEDKRERGVY